MQWSRSDERRLHEAEWLAKRTCLLTEGEKYYLVGRISVWWLRLWLPLLWRSPAFLLYCCVVVVVASTTVENVLIALAGGGLAFLAMIYSSLLMVFAKS